MIQDPLYLTIFTTDTGAVRYGCKQTHGQRYKDLYIWLSSVSYVCTSSNMPWVFFYFTDPKDELEFITRYEDEITEV